ncbi:methyltransferase [Trichothermofontia sichuanensis B231]|uniref:methyltransferase n=1 Tax=Trichothermofontia sichuanensis TaxID=3045816 RepID=UPI00224765CB|nr:methyltransferase [Trichothermofontia sichuanensis]UZQ54569.1 methyltransferase [Trichothermofontia sichuanensis B231]
MLVAPPADVIGHPGSMKLSAMVGKSDGETDRKAQIAATFGQAAVRYDQYAHVQREYAIKLMMFLQRFLADQPRALPPGRILEIGCGTGLITQQLLAHFPDRTLEITDLSPAMLAFCRQQVQPDDHPAANLHFRQLDGEAPIGVAAPYALIVTGFTIQWFSDPLAALRRYLQWLEPGGILLVAFPDDRSFPEWRLACQTLALPFTANPLPHTASLVRGLSHPAIALQCQQEMSSGTYPCAADFFRGLKAIGAHSPAHDRQLTTTQFRQLLRYLDQHSQPVIISYGVTLLLAQVHSLVD